MASQATPAAEKSKADPTRGRRLTPMMRQYAEAKAECPGAILMFRMGDFYEMFFDDAEVAARELELTLTAREKTADPVPMAGVPHHAVDGYIARLVNLGHTVAVCDQVEDPRQAKGLVKRAITRVVTAGTVADLEALEPGRAAYLARVERAGDEVAVAFLDLLVGELLCTRCPRAQVGDELRRMSVREVLVEPDDEDWLRGALGEGPTLVRNHPRGDADDAEVRASLQRRFATDGIEGSAHGGDALDRVAVDVLLRFAEQTQRRALVHVAPPRAYRLRDYVVLDESTRRNLELSASQSGDRYGSLLWHLDRCRTAVGSRTLARWIVFPLRQPEAIAERLDGVEAFVGEASRRQEIGKALEQVRDIERLAGRVAVGRANPRDLAALLGSLEAVQQVQGSIVAHPSPLSNRWAAVDGAADVRTQLQGALADDVPLSSQNGGIFRVGYRPDLDELITLSTEGHAYLTHLETRERERTGIAKLKVRYNRVFGYYIEVSRAQLDQVPDDYERKQTLVGAERFITPELKEYEAKVLTADERRKAREAELFEELLATLTDAVPRLRGLARLVGETDALLSLAQVADAGGYVRPELVSPPVIDIDEGRHPVVERLVPGGEPFVPNTVSLNAESRQLLIVTGPNMAGKSTVLRQVALTALMAHMGSFVPAGRARVGLCDRIFTRVGASDDLGRGRSTFMVEMIETAAILRHATAQSLIVLDEIGRGTSTFDGLSLAWAVAEHLHDEVGARALFATHYHELTDLALDRPRIHNVCVAVQEEKGEIVFLRRLVDGSSNRSYGIQVGQLAGLPAPVLDRAREILANLEACELDARGRPALARSRREAPAGSQLPLFTQARESKVEARLRALDPNTLTPLQALTELDALRRLLEPDA